MFARTCATAGDLETDACAVTHRLCERAEVAFLSRGERGIAMNNTCTHCGQPLELPWKFCSNCGMLISHPEETSVEHPAPEPAPVKGAFGGMFFGFVAAPLLLVVGSLLCLTGLGAFLGVPMIIAGVLAPLAGSLYGMAAPKGKAI
jgi:hypothetical protein